MGYGFMTDKSKILPPPRPGRVKRDDTPDINMLEILDEPVDDLPGIQEVLVSSFDLQVVDR